jgi:branched-chain amino acid transport system substrate-binding protein
MVIFHRLGSIFISKTIFITSIFSCFCSLLLVAPAVSADTLKIGLNYPATGRYKEHGFAQAEGAILAVEEINNKGGVLGKKLELLTDDTAFDAERAANNAAKQAAAGASMLFGGSSSDVARALGREASRQNLIYFATQASANELTGTKGHSHIFRESISAHMGARAIAHYLKAQVAGKRFFYITASDSWGFSAEASMRAETGTTDTAEHQGIPVQYLKPSQKDLENALAAAVNSPAEVLVLSQYGKDLATILQLVKSKNMQERFTIVVPVVDLETARETGAGAMEGVIGALAWNYDVPAAQNLDIAKRFVDRYMDRFQHYPSAGAASAYNVVYEYADAVKQAGSTDTGKVIKALENHRYNGVKGEQQWRGFDHQNLQTVYVVKGRPRAEVMSDQFKENFFVVVDQLGADTAAISQPDWIAERKAAGQPDRLE